MHNSGNNFDIFAKLVAISIVGGVAKSLFGPARPASSVAPILSSVGENVAKRASSSS